MRYRLPLALTAVKGQARYRGSLWSPLTAAPLREPSTYGGMGLPAPLPSRQGAPVNTNVYRMNLRVYRTY